MIGTIQNGKLVTSGNFAKRVAQFKEGDKVVITLEKYRKARSLNQNSYYWGGVLPPISEHTGHSSYELDKIFEVMFAPRIIKNLGDKEITRIKHCKELNTGEFTEYIERVVAEASNLGISVMTPDQYYVH